VAKTAAQIEEVLAARLQPLKDSGIVRGRTESSVCMCQSSVLDQEGIVELLRTAQISRVEYLQVKKPETTDAGIWEDLPCFVALLIIC